MRKNPFTKRVIVALAVVVVLIVIAIPNFIKPRYSFAYEACIIRLERIEYVKMLWAKQYHKTTNDVPTWEDLRPWLEGPHEPVPLKCSNGGGDYTIGRIGELPSCSIAKDMDYYKTNRPPVPLDPVLDTTPLPPWEMKTPK